MKNLSQIILVSHNNEANNHIQNSIRECGILVNIKIALNGGHALLYLNHLNLCNKINEGIVLVLLTMDTPVVDGFKFLTEYKGVTDLHKENICVVVVDSTMDEEKRNKAISLGVSNFLLSPFSSGQFKSLINNFKFYSLKRESREAA